MFQQVVQVVPTEDYTVFVYFEDGKIVCYDVKPLLSRGVFKQLVDKDIFINTCTIMNGTLAWDIGRNGDITSCIDIDPDSLYELDAVKEFIT